MVNLRFVTDPSNDLVSKGIRCAQLGRWPSHVEAEMPDGSGYLGAHADGGVQIRPKGYDAAFKPAEFIVTLSTTDAQETAFWAFLNAQLGKGYDMLLIGSFVDGLLSGAARDWRQPDKWICSELIAAGLEAAGIVKPFPGGSLCVTPWDVFNKLSELADLSHAVPASATMLVAAEVPAVHAV